MIFNCFNVKMLIVLEQFAPGTPNLFPDDEALNLVSPKKLQNFIKKKTGQNKGRVFRIVLKIVLCISSGFKYQFSENLNKNKTFPTNFGPRATDISVEHSKSICLYDHQSFSVLYKERKSIEYLSIVWKGCRFCKPGKSAAKPLKSF